MPVVRLLMMVGLAWVLVTVLSVMWRRRWGTSIMTPDQIGVGVGVPSLIHFLG